MSLPTRGVWIEIKKMAEYYNKERSLPTRGVWIEMFTVSPSFVLSLRSLPTRGVWIEMVCI